MAGTWETQNKILPGAYLSFRTNAPLSITPGERGTVVLLQEMSVGTVGDMYEVTVTGNDLPDGAIAEDRLLINEALKGAQTVIVYNLGTEHVADTIDTALAALMTVNFDVLVYPYDEVDHDTNKSTIETWLDMMQEEETMVQAVLANYEADNENIINVTHGVELENGTELTAAQATAWVGGVSAGASVSQSNTGRVYQGAIDVIPRMIKSEMETAITNGEFIFKVDNAQNVTAVYDINSLTTFTHEKGKQFGKNRVLRTITAINNDVTEIFESNYVGKLNNNTDGRSLLRGTLIEYFNELQRMQAIQNFTPEDVVITAGAETNAVAIECNIQPVDSIEKIYIAVNLT